MWILVIVVGTLLATLTGKSPIQAIMFAQAANGILLPVVVVFLLFLPLLSSFRVFYLLLSCVLLDAPLERQA